MCGRFSLFTDVHEMGDYFAIDTWSSFWEPRYNVSPGQEVLAVISENGQRVAQKLKWGLVPHWSKGGPERSMINARAESVASKPSFRESFYGRRCIIPADGFFEWNVRQPIFFRVDPPSVFGFAGIYDLGNKGMDNVKSCAIITCEPNNIVRSVHDRMPVMLRRDSFDLWLDPLLHDRDTLQLLLKPFNGEMTSHLVSPNMNSTSFEGPSCINPYEPPVDDQKTLGDYF